MKRLICHNDFSFQAFWEKPLSFPASTGGRGKDFSSAAGFGGFSCVFLKSLPGISKKSNIFLLSVRIITPCINFVNRKINFFKIFA
ncbi:hypothetical protein [Neglectibacter caecimuris]|uniref:hypothetical protein n=1 Tax=Neglectibacter caecimuris TaxID=3093658 RepID=UPI002AC9C9BF|nr:hypothetical protein [Neglectibacter sp. M00184]